MYESAESDIQGAYVGAPCKLICVRKAATAAQLVVARPMGGTTLSAEGQYRGSAMESQEQSPGDVVTAGEDSHPITQAIDTVEVMHAGATAPAANTMDPPTIPLAPMKRMQARFNPLADGLMYVVVFVGGFVGVGCRHALDMLLPSVGGTPFVVGTFVSNMVACFLFAMLTEFMATASWLRRRVRQVVSRGVGLGLLGGLSTMSGVMLETMEGLHERHIASALGYLAGNFAGGLLTAAAGVVLMQALLSRSTRKRVRGAFSAVSVSDSAESDTQGVRHVKVADVARSAAQAAMEAAQAAQQAAQTAQQIAQTGQVPRVETPTVPPTAIQPMQTGHVPQIPPLVVPQLTQSSQPLLREPDTSDLGSCPRFSSRSQSSSRPTRFHPASSPNRSLRRFRLSPTRLPGRCADDVDDLSVRRSGSHGPLRARRVNSTRLEPRESKNESQLPAIHARHQRRRLAMRGHRHDVLLFAIGGYGHGHDVRCRISRWFLNILHGAQRSGFIDSPASFYAGSGLWNSNRRGASHLCGRRFRHCAACQSGVIFTLHGRSLSNVKEI